MQQNWKKPQDFDNPTPMATHYFRQLKQTTFLQGKEYPIKFMEVLPGDRISFDLNDLINSDPMLAPLHGMYRLTFSSYFESSFNLYGWMRDNDQLEVEQIINYGKHRFNLPLIPNGRSLNLGISSVEEVFVQNVLPDYRDTSFGGPVVERFYDENEGIYLFRYNPKQGVGRGSLLDYLGIAPGFIGVPKLNAGGKYVDKIFSTSSDAIFNAERLLTYLDIIRCRYVNIQTNNDAGISFIPMQSRISGDVSENLYTDISLKDLDGFFKWLRTKDESGVFFNFDEYAEPDSLGDNEEYFLNLVTFNNPFDAQTETDDYYKFWFLCILWRCLEPHCGLFSAQYRPDVYRNLLNFKNSNYNSTISTSGANVTIDTVRFQNKLQRIIDRLDISGGRISSWLRTLWGVETRRNFSTPEILGVVTRMIDPQTITALAQTGEVGAPGSTDVGQFAGNVDSFGTHRRVSFVATEPGTLCIMMELVPIVTYSQNIEPELRCLSFGDTFNPEFANIGFEGVPISNYTALPETSFSLTDIPYPGGTYEPIETDSGLIVYPPANSQGFLTLPTISSAWLTDNSEPLNLVIGRNVAWSRYMTEVNRCHGEYSNFGSREYWVNKRRFTRVYDSVFENEFQGISNTIQIQYTKRVISPYVDYLDFQYHFADQDPYTAHWYLNLYIDLKATRKVPKRYMPNLERE